MRVPRRLALSRTLKLMERDGLIARQEGDDRLEVLADSAYRLAEKLTT
jgi:DNA-binding HxlR family transcriptional regulator